MKIIARIKTDFKEKFGIPRQSGIAACRGKIVFEPEYRSREALVGIEGYSHLWIIWKFSEAERDGWSRPSDRQDSEETKESECLQPVPRSGRTQ